MEKESLSDAAALAYIQICLKGRAMRLNQKWNTLYKREKLILNEPVFDTDSKEEKIDHLPDEKRTIEVLVTDKLYWEHAMTCLTPKETKVLVEIFWNEKKISQLCSELQVSKKTVLKTKQNALKKIRMFIG